MKKTVMAVMCLCLALSANAQVATFASNRVQFPDNGSVNAPQNFVVSPVVKKVSQRVPLAPGLRMRKAGQTMTILGGVLFVGGIALVSQAEDSYYYSTTSGQYGTTVEEGDPKYALGILMAVHGVGLTVPGIILWTKGNKKFNRWTEEQRQQNISMGFQRSGVGIGFRF